MNGARSRSNSGGRTPRANPLIKTPNRVRSASSGRLTPMNTQNGMLFADFQSEHDLSDVSKIKVFIRIRPLCISNRQSTCIHEKENCVLVQQGDKTLNFACDGVFDQSSSQSQVYETLAKDLLVRFLEGINVCIFAYGQTSSGKTHSILGTNSDPGVLPRFCQDLFTTVTKDLTQGNVFIEVLFYELYLEKAYDLLSDSRVQVRIRGGDFAYLENVTKVEIDCFSKLESLLSQGVSKRARTATLVNEFSSRSHAIFQIVFRRNICEVVNNIEKKSIVLSNCYFVDLAGSERLDMAGYGNRVESAAINCSLLALQKVIDAKSTSVNTFVNYRESALTRLLKECFGGNSITTLLATVNPEFQYTGLSIGTLRFAAKAALVCQTPKTNIDPFVTAVQDLIAENNEMRAELEKLKKNFKDSSFVQHTTPCLIELFSDALLNKWHKITNEKVEFLAAANDLPFIVCYEQNQKVFIKVLHEWVVLNGNFAIKDVEVELFDKDRIVLNGMRFFIYCSQITDDFDLKKLPTYESVKLEYVEGTFTTVEKKLREEARREFEEDKNALVCQMNVELEKTRQELIEVNLKMEQEFKNAEHVKLKQEQTDLKTCAIETSEIKQNLLVTSDNNNLFSGLHDLKNEEKLELIKVQACVSTSNNILEKFNKRSMFVFKLVQNSSREVERVSVRLMNLKGQTFTDLTLKEFCIIFNALVKVYQNSAAIRDGINDLESILYGGNWVWKKSIPGQRSNILSTALYNSMCNVAKSRRSSVVQIHCSLASRKSILSEAIDQAVNCTKRSSVLESQLQLFRVNSENCENLTEFPLTVNLLNWAFELSERLQDANEHILNCQNENGQRINGIEPPEHLAVYALHVFVLAVCRLETAVNCLDRNSVSLQVIVDEMVEVMSLITSDKNRWILAVSAKSESASFFVNIMMKHLNMMYRLIGRLAFVCGESFPDKTLSTSYPKEVCTIFDEGVLQSVDESCEGTIDFADAFEDDFSSVIHVGKVIPSLCKSIIKAHNAISRDFSVRVAFDIIRPLLYVRNTLTDTNANFGKVVKVLKSVSCEVDYVGKTNKNCVYLMKDIKFDLDYIINELSKYIDESANEELSFCSIENSTLKNSEAKVFQSRVSLTMNNSLNTLNDKQAYSKN